MTGLYARPSQLRLGRCQEPHCRSGGPIELSEGPRSKHGAQAAALSPRTRAQAQGLGGTRGCEDRGLRPLSATQTYIGSILVSVNPYRMFGIYGLEQVHQYRGRALGENPP